MRPKHETEGNGLDTRTTSRNLKRCKKVLNRQTGLLGVGFCSAVGVSCSVDVLGYPLKTVLSQQICRNSLN